MIIKPIFLVAFTLFSFLRGNEALPIESKEQLQLRDSLTRVEADSLWALRKWYQLDFSGGIITGGPWRGKFLSIDPKVTGSITLELIINTSKQNITGSCSIRYSHFDVVYHTFEELRIRDSIRSLKNIGLIRKYRNTQYKVDSTYWATYNESYKIKGLIKGDSLYFQIDTVYPPVIPKQKIKERHYRFQGKCMKYFDLTSYKRPNYFIIGNYIDSAFLSFPAFGSFILNKQRD